MKGTVGAGLGRRAFLSGAAGLAAASAGGIAYATGEATLVITNARVWTGDGQLAEAVAIAGNRILAVGSSAAMRQLASAGARVIDAGRRFVMPGFNDSHLHLTGMAADYLNVSLLGTNTMDEVLGRIKERVAKTPPGQWVMARSQWHEALLKEGRMVTRADLDPISPENPVYIPRGGHVATCNSKALAIAGITRDTPNPPGGIIVRDANGEPTGLLLEQAKLLVRGRLPTLTPEQYAQNLKAQIADCNSCGLTSLTNPGTSADAMRQLTAMHGTGALNMRVNWTTNLNTAAGVREFRASYAPLQGDDMLRFSGIGETGTDGGIEGAYLREPYNIVPGEQDDPTYRGVVMPWAKDKEAFAEFYLAAIEAGYNVMTHVTGDGGLDVALDTLAVVAPRGNFRPLRWTLHGCFLTDAVQLRRIKDMGLYITAQAQPYLLGMQMAKWWGRARADRSIPVRSFIDARIPTGLGSDASAGIVNPLESLSWFVNRLCLGDLQMDKKWSITPQEALRLYTYASAETQFMDQKTGRLKKGMLADIAVLEENPLTVARAEIPKIKTDATITDGRVVFDRNSMFS